jgi:glycosyltransferase involved in cell wall biosynthesis
MTKFSLVIPAYNEEKNLPQLLERTMTAAREAGMNGDTFTLLLVENGSRDRSLEVMRQLIEKNGWEKMIRIVQVRENRGYGFGIMSGLREADGDIVGWTHADLQCDPGNAFIAYKLLMEQKDRKVLVKGTRLGRAPQERFISRVFEITARLILGLKTGEINAQPKVFDRGLLQSLDNPPLNFALDVYLLYKAQKQGYISLSFEVVFPPRIHGVSNWAVGFAGRYKTIWGIIRYMWTLARTEGRA